MEEEDEWQCPECKAFVFLGDNCERPDHSLCWECSTARVTELEEEICAIDSKYKKYIMELSLTQGRLAVAEADITLLRTGFDLILRKDRNTDQGRIAQVIIKSSLMSWIVGLTDD